jgi:hypothetical protein
MLMLGRTVRLVAPLAVGLVLCLWGVAAAARGSAPGGPSALPKGASVSHRFLHILPAPKLASPGTSVTPEAPGAPSTLLAGANGETLEYHGGEVQHKPELYLLFWGNNFFNGTAPFYEGAGGNEHVSLYTEYKGFLDDLSNELSAPGEASWQGILSQYYGAAAGGYGDGTVVGEADYTEANSQQAMTAEDVQLMINWWVARGLKQGPNTEVIVFTAPGTTMQEDPSKEILPGGEERQGCGNHGIDQQGSAYAYVPYEGDINRYFEKHRTKEELETGLYSTCNLRTEHNEAEATQLMWSSTSVASHEYAETVTDPGYGGKYAWFSVAGGEIGDLCAHSPVDSVELPARNGRPGWWYVTELWDDEGGNTCKLEDPPYPAPPPPSATTEAATGIHPTQATLKGSINPNGPDAHYKFEYGTTTSYGEATPEADAGFGTNPIGVGAAVSYLNAHTTYHYRLVAWTWGGTTYGPDETFTTPYEPPEVRIGGATLIGPTIATVHAEVQQIEYGNPRTSYFEYGTTTSYGQKTPERNETSYTSWTPLESALSGLAPKTLYHYRFVAYNNGGTAYSADATFTTTPSPNAVTEPPTEVRTTSATLTAKLNPGGHSTTYQFEYWPNGKSAETKLLPTTPATAGSGTSNEIVSQTLSGLVPYASYSYRVVASNSVGTTRGESVTFIAVAPFTSEPTLANPEGIVSSKFESLSCASAVICMAVGEASNSEAGNHQLYSEYWTGGEWTRETIPVKTGATASYAGPVSCSAANNCFMLGNFETTSGGPPAEARWNGLSWSSGPMALSGEAPSVTFTGLNCVSGTKECFAVGFDYPTAKNREQTAFAAELSGPYDVTWNVMTLPSVGNTSELRAVSCSSTTACTAVGSYTSLGSTETISFADRWNGSEWKLQTLPVANNAELRSVSCPTGIWCMAVGQHEGKDLAERWNGSEWTVTSEPPPVSGREGAGGLTGVSCSSTTSCTAVGAGWQADLWMGSAWSTVSIEGNSGEYRAIACGGGNCTAVGSAWPGGHQTAAAAGVGPPVAESLQATAVGNGNATLNAALDAFGNETTYQFEYGPTTAYGTKVPSTPGKLAPGYHVEAVKAAVSGLKEGTTYHYRIVATSSAGTAYGADRIITPHTWALVAPATPSGSPAWRFKHAACSSVTSCVAVGDQYNSSWVEVPLAEVWNGSEWKAMTTPMPTGAKKGRLSGISCMSTTSCEAVGTYEDSSSTWRPLAMGWNGTSWSDQTVTVPGEGSSELSAVTCTSTTACILVGYYNATGGYHTLAESWNGTEWKVQTTPTSTEGWNHLEAISCASATACTTVGSALKEPLALRWNGTEWLRQMPVNPNEGFEELAGVSCASATSCEAIGVSQKNLIEGPDRTLAERWNGSEWTRQTLPVSEGKLRSISCSSGTSCTAVGGTLIEGWNGSEWSPQTPVMPSGEAALQLEGVACPTVAACIVSGYGNNGMFTEVGEIESFGPAIVNGEAASNLQATSATVNASVNPDGEVTTYRVEYGTTTGYGSSVPTPEATIASEQSAEKVSQNLTGLSTKTTYHYRFVAIDSSGVTNGPDQTFTTK